MNKIALIIMIILGNLSCMVHGTFLTITSPGDYTIPGNISYTSSGNGDSIINILSSNVTLNLDNKTITQADTSTIFGITVGSNLSNITIKNGTVMTLTGTGINVSSGCSIVTLENINVVNCTLRGISFVGTSAAPITDFSIRNCLVASGCSNNNTDYAVYLTHCNRLSTNNFTINGNINTSAMFAAFGVDSCNDGYLSNVTVNNNAFSITSTGACFLNNSSDIIMTDWIFENNTNGMTTLAFLTSTSNILVNHCIFIKNNPSGITASGNGTAYIIFPNANNFLTFDNCIAQANTSSSAVGFVPFGSVNRSSLLSCIATNNIFPASTAIGFNTNGLYYEVIRCISENNIAVAGSSFGFAADASTSAVYQDNISAKNLGKANSFGYSNNSTTNCIFLRNVAMQNGTTASNQFFGSNFTTNNYYVATSSFTNGVIVPWINYGIVS